ncbi:peptide-N(4)-(N-acetyl-beta-glucosaminyl)asparagine amidase [Culicoides brevitarsis]|uniref:peptide-N(4)-(N-acetyl-beta- glucosaminyl)asparagine amidase n=1 Tax=Culicoides brevitarsis TaxID=469753 RepID=UPI00307BD4EC
MVLTTPADRLSLKHLADVKQKNSQENIKEGLKILLKLLDNVIAEPGNDKYRRIRCENKIIKEKLLSLKGMDSLLTEIGFVFSDESYALPSSVMIACLRNVRQQIDQVLTEGNEPSTSSTTTGAIKKESKEPKKPEIVYKSAKSFKERTNFPKVIFSGNQFLQNLEHLSDKVMQYEDPVLQETGRSVIPIEKLKQKTLESLRRIQKQIKTGNCKEMEPSYDDLFLYELAEWFRNDFFTWVNQAKCPVCGNENTQAVGQTSENGNRIEQYRCCNRIINFYRYNDVLQLLQTRKGRCGEYANCFTFLCRCLGYRARYIFSTEDHVWTEVYSTLQNRWIHVDPSDGVVDAPLMYEHGWKQNIRYVIAFSNDDVQDVTWRYTNQHKKVLRNRNKCTEKELLDTILALRNKRQAGKSEYWIKNYKKRALRELADFMLEREPTEDEKRGRSSGSLAWRQARMETNVNSFYVFEPLEAEINAKQFNLRYSCTRDLYERYLLNSSKQANVLETKQNWDSLVYHADKIFKKYEPDWKMCYLARLDTDEGTSGESSIMWRFDFSGKNLKIDNLQYKFETKTFENGKIDVFFMDKNGLRVTDLKELKGETKFSIKAVLSGGNWQHTQLFRQEKGSSEYPFVLNIKFA